MRDAHRLPPARLKSDSTYVVVLVFGNGESRIAATTDLDNAFRQWSFRHGAFLPVAAFPADVAAFTEAAQILRLPKTAPTEWVADLLHRAPVELSAQPAVLRHIHRLGVKAEPLFDAWRRAVTCSLG